MRTEVICADVSNALPTMEPESFDAVLCDPPYGLSFMGKQWDHGVPSAEVWREVLRVVKPGGHLIAFGGTRTFHRLTCAIEDAGFEIRDCLAWLYGQGFPKSLAIDKAIDKMRTDGADVARVVRFLEAARVASGVSRQRVEEEFGTVNIGQGFFTLTPGSTPRVPTLEQWSTLKRLLAFGDELDAEVERLNAIKGEPGEAWAERPITGEHESPIPGIGGERFRHRDTLRRDVPATERSAPWKGYGTALKPAWEPAILAMKPLRGTFAGNALAHGVAGVNVDGCRLATGDKLGGGAEKDSQAPKPEGWDRPWRSDEAAQAAHAARIRENVTRAEALGRWPANVALDEEAAAMLDEQSGERGGGFGVRGAGPLNGRTAYALPGQGQVVAFGDSGGASRFFYVAKASRGEREAGLEGFVVKASADAASMPTNQRCAVCSGWKTTGDTEKRCACARPDYRNIGARNHHPTVKPIRLAEWLARLLLPPQRGTPRRLLVPFAGSGSEMIGALLAGWEEVVGIEREAEYVEIAQARLAHWMHDLEPQADLFAERTA